MKRNWTLLLASLLLVLALTACGQDDKESDPVPNDVPTTEDSMANPGTDSSATDNATNGPTDDGSLIGDAGTDIANGVDDVEDALTGENPTSKSGIPNQTGNKGVTYEQMLRNARVHDRDGNLRDHENAATSGGVY